MTHTHRIVAYSQLHPLARAIVLQSALTNPLLTDDGRPVMLPLEVPVAPPRRTPLAHSVGLACRFWHTADAARPEDWARLGIDAEPFRPRPTTGRAPRAYTPPFHQFPRSAS